MNETYQGSSTSGEVAKTRYLRTANARGFDDAAFKDKHGNISEATIWNLAFWDGEHVIWREAEVLPGVTMQILTPQIEALGTPQQTRSITEESLSTGLSAVVMNSWTPGIQVSRIGNQALAQDPKFTQLLHEAYENEPWNSLHRSTSESKYPGEIQL